jgi:hypothetical protein
VSLKSIVSYSLPRDAFVVRRCGGGLGAVNRFDNFVRLLD